MKLKRNRGAVAMPDENLQRALNGDREALGSLFAAHTPKLYRAALRIVGKPQDAEDALQDGFLCAIRHLEKFERRALFSTWLTRIVVNSALMRLRKHHREVLTRFDQEFNHDETAFTLVPVEPGPNPEEICERNEKLQRFQHKLRSLPAGYRSILWMRDVEGMSAREAAETLGVKPTTVKSQLFRARLKLKMGNCSASRGHQKPSMTPGATLPADRYSRRSDSQFAGTFPAGPGTG